MRFHLTSKTVLGALFACAGYLSQPDVLAVLPHNVAALITTAGVILSAIGIRSRLDVVQGVAQSAAADAANAAATGATAAAQASDIARAVGTHTEAVRSLVSPTPRG